jgi:cytochrome P450
VTATTELPSLPPGPRLPATLATLAWFFRPGSVLENCRARFGDAFTLRLPNEAPLVMLSDPDAIKQVFTGDPRLLHAGEANTVLLPILGSHSVLLLDDALHMEQRKLLLPPLHGERMQRYGELMTEIAAREVDRWPIGRPLRLWPRMQAVTLEIIMRAVFGVEEKERLERVRVLLSGLLDRLSGRGRFLVALALGPKRIAALSPFRRALEPIDRMLYDLIEERRRDLQLSKREDILSLLLQARHEDGRQMSASELRDELMTLLVAGHETTATALSWSLERLVRHPDKLERLEDEIEKGGEAYLEAVVKETLRLRPVIAFVRRRLTEPMEIGGRLLPAGVTVAPCIYLLHRRPDIYPEPNRFLPERFLDSPPGTYTWIPFGGGVRRCIGAAFAQFEMQTVLRTLVSRMRLRPVHPRDERMTRRTITLTPSRRAEMIVEPRPGTGPLSHWSRAGDAFRPEADVPRT